MKNIYTKAVAVGLALSVMGVSLAAQISIPNIFTAGTTASSSEVNANFETLVVESNDQDQRIAVLESSSAIAKSNEYMTCEMIAENHNSEASKWFSTPDIAYAPTADCLHFNAGTVSPRGVTLTDIATEGWVIDKIESYGPNTYGGLIVIYKKI